MQMDVYDAAERYQQENVQLVLLVGKDYGSGSSRDWAAKGPYLLVSFKPELNRLYILPGFLWFYNPNNLLFLFIVIIKIFQIFHRESKQ